MNLNEIDEFRHLIYSFYAKNRRSFPWRETSDPYEILVSEFMLQQTQTERVVKKYPLFISAFPNFESLDKASLREVFLLWQGLGYNRRAKALKDVGRVVIERGGNLPQNPRELMELPFIGQSTGGAICAFAFGYPSVFIETNIRRVFIHTFFSPDAIVSDKEILPLVASTLDRRDPRNWYYALMDYGVFLKRSTGMNSNLRSAQYTVQPTFRNSNRELRGKIVKLLLESDTLSADRIAAATGTDCERVYSCLRALSKDGIVAETVEGFRAEGFRVV